MMCKDRTRWLSAMGLSGLGAMLLLAGCSVPPSTRQASTLPAADWQATLDVMPTATWVLPGPGTPLPSMCGNTTTVEAYPSDAFRLRILVKDSHGAPAPGVQITLAFVDGYDLPVFPPLPLISDEQGYAVFELAQEKLIMYPPLPIGGDPPGSLLFNINASWPDAPLGPEVLYFTCGGQDFDPLRPLDILVTIHLIPKKE